MSTWESPEIPEYRSSGLCLNTVGPIPSGSCIEGVVTALENTASVGGDVTVFEATDGLKTGPLGICVKRDNELRVTEDRDIRIMGSDDHLTVLTDFG